MKKDDYKKLLKDGSYKAVANEYIGIGKDLNIDKNNINKIKKSALILVTFNRSVDTHDITMKLIGEVSTSSIREYTWNNQEDTIAIEIQPSHMDVVAQITVNISKVISLVHTVIIQPQRLKL